jgi:hypothetical protein
VDGDLRARVFLFRLGLTAVLALYLAAVIATGFIPLAPVLDVPLALAGWLCVASLIVWAVARHHEPQVFDMWGELLHPLPLAVVFVVLVLIASYFALAWQVPAACHGISINCFKAYEWRTQGDQYLHITPDGLIRGISRATYVQEVGVHLRSAAAFGIYSLCLAWAAASTLSRTSGGAQQR